MDSNGRKVQIHMVFGVDSQSQNQNIMCFQSQKHQNIMFFLKFYQPLSVADLEKCRKDTKKLMFWTFLSKQYRFDRVFLKINTNHQFRPTSAMKNQFFTVFSRFGCLFQCEIVFFRKCGFAFHTLKLAIKSEKNQKIRFFEKTLKKMELLRKSAC